ncbi:serine hydrolase domain-containing protein [Paenibacillus sediminis]|uniref:CubicO group peptidase (Beta-lactamase class C family) n=1 Tax=Paenibacillus sediminis TaxID=664909 RepID=A0ABS4H544_9BACL|nr:serine hydrolase domain-containing protein [Paenibacillus sediminis]MBP1937644.1 CubicO group peptidase (beta-lactamase class C family) [Paenibacillus sediminis]
MNDSVPFNLVQYIEKYNEIWSLSGNILISQGGTVLFKKSFGKANFENNVDNTLKTKFYIGSISKQFAAALTLILYEEGKISLCESVRKYMPLLPRSYQTINIHHLLTHSSGIPDYYECVIDFEKYHDKIPYTNDEFLELYKNKPLDFEVGNNWKYSNSGWHLLGMILEKITDQPFEECMHNRIFDPLEMTDTGYDIYRSIIPFKANGYVVEGDILKCAPFYDMGKLSCSGGIYSTTADLLKWDNALYEERLLSKSSLQLMFRKYLDKYGYGWFIDTRNNKTRFFHSGRVEGYRSRIIRYPETKHSIIYLSNIDAEIDWLQDIESILFGGDYRLPYKPQKVQVDEKTLYELLGEYKSMSGKLERTFTFSKENDRYYFKWNSNPKFEVYPISNHCFRPVNWIDMTHEFRREGSDIWLYEYKKNS